MKDQITITRDQYRRHIADLTNSFLKHALEEMDTQGAIISMGILVTNAEMIEMELFGKEDEDGVSETGYVS